MHPAIRALKFLLRLSRIWFSAMRLAGNFKTWRVAVRESFAMALAAYRARPFVSRSVWLSRMRACSKCSLFVRSTYQCNGCGCAMPVKNLFDGQTCWARQTGKESPGVGWPPDVF